MATLDSLVSLKAGGKKVMNRSTKKKNVDFNDADYKELAGKRKKRHDHLGNQETQPSKVQNLSELEGQQQQQGVVTKKLFEKALTLLLTQGSQTSGSNSAALPSEGIGAAEKKQSRQSGEQLKDLVSSAGAGISMDDLVDEATGNTLLHVILKQRPVPLAILESVLPYCSDEYILKKCLNKATEGNTIESKPVQDVSDAIMEEAVVSVERAWQNQSENILHVAVNTGNHRAVNIIIDSLKQRNKQKALDNLFYSFTIKYDENNKSLCLNSLHIAARNGDLGIVKTLIDAGMRVSTRTDKKNTPLHYAAEYNHAEVVKYLLDQGANRNETNSVKDTALHFACRKGHTLIVEVLLKHKTKYIQHNEIILDCARKTGFIYPLITASALGHLEIVKLLLEEEQRQKKGRLYKFNQPQERTLKIPISMSASTEQKPDVASEQFFEVIHDCPLENDSKKCQTLLSSGFQRFLKQRTKNSKKLRDQGEGILRDRLGMTALHWAAKEGYIDIVKLLHSTYVDIRGIDGMPYVNQIDKDGNDALIHAAMGKHYDIVKYLIEWKKCTDCQHVPLMDASSSKQLCESCNKTLVCQNCLAVYRKEPRTISCFYDAHCNGCMLKEFAKCNKEVKCIKFRGDSFKAINHLNSAGESFWTHLMMQCLSGEEPHSSFIDPGQIKNILELVSCNMETWLRSSMQNSANNLPLHSAAMLGQTEVIKTLLDSSKIARYDLPPDHRDKDKKTFLHIAAQCNQFNLLTEFAGWKLEKHEFQPPQDDGKKSRNSGSRGWNDGRQAIKGLSICCPSKVEQLEPVEEDSEIKYLRTLEKREVKVAYGKMKFLCNTQDENGDTPLHILLDHSNNIDPGSLDVLIEYTDLSITNRNNETVVHAAVRHSESASGNQEQESEITAKIVDSVIQNHSMKHLRKKERRFRQTVLHLVAQMGKHYLVKHLHNVKPGSKDSYGRTAAQIAIHRKDIDFLQELITVYQASNCPISIDDELLLHFAVTECNRDAVEYLLLQQADLAKTDQEGDTALHKLAWCMSHRKESESEYMKILVLFEGYYVITWWCRHRKLTLPNETDDAEIRILKRQALKYLLTEIANNYDFNVLQLAARYASSGFLCNVLNIEDVYKFHRRENYYFDVTGLLPITSKAPFEYGKDMLEENSKVYFLRSQKDDSTWNREPIEPLDYDVRDPKYEGNKWTVAEIIVHSKDYDAVDKLLSVSPFQDILSLNQWFYFTFLNLMLVFHIFYMLTHTNYALVFDPCLIDGNSSEAVNGSADNSSSFKANFQENVSSKGSAMTFIAFFCIFVPIVYLLYHISWYITLLKAAALYRKGNSTRIPNFTLQDINHLIGILIMKALGSTFTLLTIGWYISAFVGSCGFNIRLIVACSVIFGWVYTLDFLCGMETLHRFIIILRQMIMSDIFKFLLIYLTLLMAFALGLTVVQGGNLTGAGGSVIYLAFNWMLGMGDAVEYVKFEYDVFIRNLYAGYMITSAIVLLNLLIAMMSDSYAELRKTSESLFKTSSLQIQLESEGFFSKFRKVSSKLKYDFVFVCDCPGNIHNRKGNRDGRTSCDKEKCRNPARKILWLLEVHQDDFKFSHDNFKSSSQ